MSNFYILSTVAAPWEYILLQSENQDLRLNKKAHAEGSFSGGFMPESVTCSVGLPAFPSNNTSH